MVDVILCLVAFCFMGWVLVLKAEIVDLKTEIRRLKQLLSGAMGTLRTQVEVQSPPKRWRRRGAPAETSRP